MARIALKPTLQPELFVYSFPVRVYFENTDAGGVVYHAEYLKFMERARTEWLRHLGFDHQALGRVLRKTGDAAEAQAHGPQVRRHGVGRGRVKLRMHRGQLVGCVFHVDQQPIETCARRDFRRRAFFILKGNQSWQKEQSSKR